MSNNERIIYVLEGLEKDLEQFDIDSYEYSMIHIDISHLQKMLKDESLISSD